MTPQLVASLLAALDFFLHHSAAFAAIIKVHDTFSVGRSDRARIYSAAWEATFAACLEAMLVVSQVLSELGREARTYELPDRQLGNELARALGESERFTVVLTNYRAALSDFRKAEQLWNQLRAAAALNASLQAICSGEAPAGSDEGLRKAWEVKEALDTRRGTWYRELHTSFTAFEGTLRQLNAVRAKLDAFVRECTASSRT